MNTFKRVMLSVKSQIDTVADQFENHEALAGAAIEDLQKVGVNCSVQLRHVQQMGDALEQKLNDLRIQEKQWENRAIQVAQEDKAKALECLKRLKTAQIQIQQAKNQLSKFNQIEAKINQDIQQIQLKLIELKNKKTLLAARQNRTDALSVIDQNQSGSVTNMDQLFERWEDSVVGGEFSYPDTIDLDPLANDFEKQEQQVDLELMLEELIQKAAETSNPTKPGESL